MPEQTGFLLRVFVFNVFVLLYFFQCLCYNSKSNGISELNLIFKLFMNAFSSVGNRTLGHMAWAMMGVTFNISHLTSAEIAN